jgi:hypothetical protein
LQIIVEDDGRGVQFDPRLKEEQFHQMIVSKKRKNSYDFRGV